jgi:cytidylate kinase
MIVTIDGPAGSGKSTVARALADELGFSFLDTGAMYRAIALACLQQKINLQADAEVGQIAREAAITYQGKTVFLNLQDVTHSIRTPEVTNIASLVAMNPHVRSALVEKQREFGKVDNIVTEGRDQGTIVFPQAEFKFFLTASAEVRAQRRHLELLAKGVSIDYEEIYQDQLLRDERDLKRENSPLKPAADALLVDTSAFTQDEVITRLLAIIRT